MKKAFIPIFLSLVLLSGSVGIVEAAALTQSQINAIIGLLRSFGADEGVVANVNATLGGTGASGETQQWCHTFNTNLKIGDRGDEVRALGAVLTKEGFGRVEYREGLIDPISDDGVFIEDTASAVTGFQEKYRDEILAPLGLKYGTGYVGKSTRAKLNALYGCGVTKPPVSAGYLEIEPSSASIAVGGSVSMQAMYQPPMPKCSEGFACPQVMPARFPVVAEWTSSNPKVASITGVAVGDCFTTRCQSFYSAEIKGVSNGTADIKAAYKSPSGTFLTATAKITVGSGLVVPSITVTSPNGGEVWQVGTKQLIKWSASPSITNVIIGLKTWSPSCEKSPCPLYPVSLYNIANNVSNTGVYEWVVGAGEGVVPKIPDGKYIVTVGDIRGIVDSTAASDSSDAPFSIVSGGTSTNNPPVINGIPAIPSVTKVNQSVLFSWGATDADGDNLSWSVSWGDGTGVAGACESPNQQNKQGWTFTMSHAWAKSGTYMVKATANDCRGGSNEHTFNVTVGSISTAPAITVISPNGGETFTKGQSYFIRWAQTGFASDGWIQLQLRDAVNSSTMVKLITSSVPLGAYAGSFNWTVPTDIPNGKYLIWATAGSGLDSLGTRVLGSDFSNAPFTISATPAGAADASSSGDGSFAALLFSLERQLEELERILNSLLP